MNIGIKSLFTGALLLLAGPAPSGFCWAERGAGESLAERRRGANEQAAAGTAEGGISPCST